MDRAQKEAFVADLHGRLEGAELMVVGHYRGLTVAQMTQLRGNMRQEGGEVQVSKNRLAKLAFKGTPFTVVEEFMTGPTALAFSKDPVAAAKVAQKFADDHENFVVVGGALGEKKLSAEEVKALSKMPSLDELRGKLVGLLQAPAQKIASVTQAPAGQVARVIAAKSEAA
ncbi:MAG: 50S ribosomal protein L10 [Alphaproteobacteria bacterium]|nr:50S ribosomal protein L10 [Alphaproteobacteria bacterium]